LNRFGETAKILLEQSIQVAKMIPVASEAVDMSYLKSVCMERLKKESVWSKSKGKKDKKSDT
jgi:hypothetical protein